MTPPLHPWPALVDAPCAPLSGGLINDTWRVGEPPLAVLQRLHPIFAPCVNDDIEVVTRWLQQQGLLTPRLLCTAKGDTYHLDDGGACWRALTWVEGHSYHRIENHGLAQQAGGLLARWHRAVEGLQHNFAFTRSGVHDTLSHIQSLREALTNHPSHRLRESVAPLAESLDSAWASWSGRLDLPLRLCHGDPKISNLLFHPQSGEGLCLVDLDTMGWLPLDVELGDAWRSWCNPRGEDLRQGHFDLEIFEASARGYLAELSLDRELREALPGGIERICLELAARFLADALNESYFGWSSEVAPGRGEHNLLRGQGQLSLAASARQQRSAMEAILELD